MKIIFPILFVAVVATFPACQTEGNKTGQQNTSKADTATVSIRDRDTTVAPVAAAAGDVAALLQGKWQSLDDAKSEFEIVGKKITQYYEGKKSVTNEFNYVADCSGNACKGGSSKFGCYSAAGKFDIECHSIVSISATELQTSLVGGTGNTLKYKKVK